MFHLGINLGHDRSVAIVKDGKLIAAIEQERLDRLKHSIGLLHQSPQPKHIQIPFESIQYCLEKSQTSLSDISTITANMPGADHSVDLLCRALPIEQHAKIQQISSHHLSHAYSAYWPSGFDRAIILCADASGSSQQGLTESFSIYLGENGTITSLHDESCISHLAELSTLGFLYEFISKKAGFVSHISDNISIAESGKLMGLASFGQAQNGWCDWISTSAESYSIKINSYDIALEVAALTKLFDHSTEKGYLKPYIVDLAFKVQQTLEQALLHIINLAIKNTGIKKVCLAGGIALNSVANYKLLQELQLDDIFIFPAAGDNGIAAGNAYWAYACIEKGNNRPKLTHASLGKSYSDLQIEQALKQRSDIHYVKLSESETIKRCAEKIAKGSIVARLSGGCEFGPRALGNRSIIVDPTYNKIKDVLNLRVKFRESFRPFSPVIPLDSVTDVFELQTASPFMLLISTIKKEFHSILPAITHNDGTGRVQTVDRENNPFFYSLAKMMPSIRKGPPVILNTSFNIAGQPIVETPVDALQTFSDTDIDYLSMENYWVEKKHVIAKSYSDHLQNIQPPEVPQPLSKKDFSLDHLMRELDSAVFHQTPSVHWSSSEISQFSQLYARYKQFSQKTTQSPLGKNFSALIDNRVVIFLDPTATSVIKCLQHSFTDKTYSFTELQLICLQLNGLNEELEQLRTSLHLSCKEFTIKRQWAEQQLKQMGLKGQPLAKIENQVNQLTIPAKQLLEQFNNETFNISHVLGKVYQQIANAEYSEESICQRLNINNLQDIQATYLPYYEKHLLKNTKLDNLIKLFLIQAPLPLTELDNLFDQESQSLLFHLGILNNNKNTITSNISLYVCNGFYIATDHRFLFMHQAKLNESPVMYIGRDSAGLSYTAPRYYSAHTLDLCTGSGIQAMTASRYSNQVTAIDINPRAIRFSRFNIQLNGITNIRTLRGNLYGPVSKQKFDTILANPPFVPSPEQTLSFRDGGKNGERILAQIIKEAPLHLTDSGKVFIVTDLVDVDSYQQKLAHWWPEKNTDRLILKTADRNDVLFSVPHCHYPFEQSYQDYKTELINWIDNFKAEKMKAVNFGYILIVKQLKQTSYTCKTISNPDKPIYLSSKEFFDNKKLLQTSATKNIVLCVNNDLKIQHLTAFNNDSRDDEYFLISKDNPYLSKYKITLSIYEILLGISRTQTYLSTLESSDIIYDLIDKGILKIHLSSQASDNVFTLQDKSLHTKMAATKDDKPLAKQALIEFETKTTPTCLTSYLRQ